jgi:hypothetical protein
MPKLFDCIVTSWIKTFPSFFSKEKKNAWKLLNLTQIIAPEKMWQSITLDPLGDSRQPRPPAYYRALPLWNSWIRHWCAHPLSNMKMENILENWLAWDEWALCFLKGLKITIRICFYLFILFVCFLFCCCFVLFLCCCFFSNEINILATSWYLCTASSSF